VVRSLLYCWRMTNRRPKDFICMEPNCDAASPRADQTVERFIKARAAGWTLWVDYPSVIGPGDAYCPDHKPTQIVAWASVKSSTGCACTHVDKLECSNFDVPSTTVDGNEACTCRCHRKDR
jgi:hypothetical protein